MSTNPLGQLLGWKQALRLHNGFSGMNSSGFNGVEPGTLRRQEEWQDANALSGLFDLLMALANPPTNHLALVPRGGIPDHQPVALAKFRQTLTTILEKLGADPTFGPSRYKTQPDLRAFGAVGGACLPQNAVTDQRFGVGITRLRALLDQAKRMLWSLLRLHVRLRKAAPPDFVHKTVDPARAQAGIRNQVIACVFLSRFCGSGLIIQCVARFQVVLSRLRTRRTLSSEARVSVIPHPKLTWVANSEVQVPRSLPQPRGLRCSKPYKRSSPFSEKVVRRVVGAEGAFFEPRLSLRIEAVDDGEDCLFVAAQVLGNHWRIRHGRSPAESGSAATVMRLTSAIRPGPGCVPLRRTVE